MSLLKIRALLPLLCMLPFCLNAQSFPGEDENIPYLITFGQDAPTSWGDDDFSQTFFFIIPKDHRDPVYIRVFDPDCGGDFDEPKNGYNSKTRFSLYGGREAFTHEDANGLNPVGKYDSGNLIKSKTFGVDPRYDGNWYSFGPINPSEGELVSAFNGYLLKLICDGITGDDGNIYKYFLSTSPTENIPVEGANAFTYEYSFRLPNNPTVCHIYPYIDENVISVQQSNFDWDGDGVIRIVSRARKGEPVRMSGEDNWVNSKHTISDREKNSSLDIQLVKLRSVNNNNVVFRVTNQYNQHMPFFSIPIGGRPVYEAVIEAVPTPKK